MIAAQQRLPARTRLKVIAGEEKQRRVAGRNEAPMLPPAHAAELRVVAGAGQDFLHDAIEEIRPEPGREREQQQELRLAIQTLLPHEAAVGRIVMRRGQLERGQRRTGSASC